ncbi:Rad9 family protein [Cryptosporidium serpentis]
MEIESNYTITKQIHRCLWCLAKGFKCQDLLIRINSEYIMFYCLPMGGLTSCFQFCFAAHLFDKFQSDENEIFEKIFRIAPLLNAFSNIQWMKISHVTIRTIEDDSDALRIDLIGKNGINRHHIIYSVLNSSDKILLHQNVTWFRRHALRISPGLLKDVLNYIEIRESHMTLMLSPAESQISFKISPISFNENSITASSAAAYQDIQVKNEQIDTIYICNDILMNNSFTFNSREFKVIIALAETCQLPLFITLRSPGLPMIITIGQRATIDSHCIQYSNIPFEYYWEDPLRNSSLETIDEDYLTKTQSFNGFSAVFLMSTTLVNNTANIYNLELTSPRMSPMSELNTFTIKSSQDQQIQECKSTNKDLLEIVSQVTPEKYEVIANEVITGFMSLHLFDIQSLDNVSAEKFNMDISQEVPIPPCDKGVVQDDWLSSIIW